MSDNYEDIINLPHHVSSTHPHMSVSDRAAQFAPFAALTGYGDVIKETARQTDTEPELSDDEKEKLNDKLVLICSSPGEKAEITIVYFIRDERKAGGAYHTACGRIRRINSDEGKLILEDGAQIDLESIVDISFERNETEKS